MASNEAFRQHQRARELQAELEVAQRRADRQEAGMAALQDECAALRREAWRSRHDSEEAIAAMQNHAAKLEAALKRETESRLLIRSMGDQLRERLLRGAALG